MVRIFNVIDETIRILSLVLILAPSSYLLPRKWAMGIAKFLSFLLIFSPASGPHIYWQMRVAYGKGRLDSFKLAWDWLGRGYLDFLVHRRLIHKLENPLNWQIVERNAENIKRLRESGESYIVAGGHFQHGFSCSMYVPSITYGRVIRVSDPVKKIRSLKDLRTRYQFGMNMKSFAYWAGKNAEIIFNEPDMRTARKIYNRLCVRGNVVFIDVDAIWKKSNTRSYERPFAGSKSRVFATGTAELARMAKCPVICCVHFIERDGTIVLEWGPPILNGGTDGENVIDVMNKLIDQLEIAIGERPTQYVFQIGGDRRWNPQRRHWEEFTV